MNHSKPTVTIDLAEYNELRQLQHTVEDLYQANNSSVDEHVQLSKRVIELKELLHRSYGLFNDYRLIIPASIEWQVRALNESIKVALERAYHCPGSRPAEVATTAEEYRRIRASKLK